MSNEKQMTARVESDCSPITFRTVRQGYRYIITTDGQCADVDGRTVAFFSPGLPNVQDQILKSVADLNAQRLSQGKGRLIHQRDFWRNRKRASGRAY